MSDSYENLSQKIAANLRGSKILLSSSAGTGKTTVLTDRILNAILYENISIDEMIVMTFTVAAANEMRSRIKEKLEEKLSETELNSSRYRYIKRQIRLFSMAKISTIDSFCSNLVRENIDLTKANPNFSVLTPEENLLLINEVCMSMIEDIFSYFEDGEVKDENIIKLVDEYGLGKAEFKYLLNALPTKTDVLANNIIKIYMLIMKTANPIRWLDERISEESFENNNIKRYILDELKAVVDNINSKKEKFDTDEVKICDIYNKLNSLSDLDMFFVELDKLFELKHSLNFNDKEENNKSIDMFNDIISCIKNTLLSDNDIADIKEFIDRYNDEINVKYALVKPLCKLTKILYAKVEDRKIKLNKFMFDDISHMALDLLWKDNEITELAKSIRKNIKEVLIDEYQDSSRVQEKIFDAVNNGNSFYVGDVKQCIYSFRNADPKIFTDKLYSYSEYNETEKNENVKLFLDKNYRSEKNVLDFVNSVFENLMIKNVSGIDYDENQMLKHHKSNDYNACEFIYKSSDDEEDIEEIEEEIYMIADRINAMVDSEEYLIYEGKEKRKIRYSDIAVLYPSLKKYTNKFNEIFSQKNIPFHISIKGGYFEVIEVKQMISVLKAIENPNSDIDLCVFLKMPFNNISDIDLAEYRIRSNDNNLSLYASLNKALHNFGEVKKPSPELEESYKKLERAMQLLNRYISLRNYTGVVVLIQSFYDETGYLQYVTAMKNGDVKRENLLLLLEKAKGTDKNTNLFEFIRYFDLLMENGKDMDEASSVNDSDDVVSVMTIHKSKGLGYPVCFIGALGDRFNKRDLYDDIYADENMGIITNYIDEASGYKDNSIEKNVLKFIKQRELIAEKIRLLYVALTRAKNYLILVSRKNIREYIDENNSDKKSGYIGEEKILKSSSLLDLILLNLGKIVEENKIVLKGISLSDIKEDVKNEIQDAYLKKVPLKDALKEAKSDNHLLDMISFDYKKNHDYIFEKHNYSVSELKKQADKIKEFIYESDDYENGIILEQPVEKELGRYINYNKNVGGKFINNAKRGSIYHKILELLDYGKDYNEDELKAFVKNLYKSNKIEDMDCVDIKDIADFINSDLGALFKSAFSKGCLKREEQFYMSLNVDNNEDLLVQGIIDAYIVEDDGIILIDYKTDEIGETQFGQRYEIQLKLYSIALESAYENKKVKKRVIWSFYNNKAIDI